MGLISGLLQAGASLFRSGAPAIAGPALGRVAGGGISGAVSAAGRALTSPIGGGVVGGVLGGALTSFFGGEEEPQQFQGGAFAGGMGGAVQVLPGSPLGQIMASGAQTQGIVGGRFLATAPNGDVQLFNRHGFPIRPAQIIPAGQRMPGGATVVSVRQGGQLIGITLRRRRRTFAGEVARTRHVLAGCRAIERACAPPKRRSAHR